MALFDPPLNKLGNKKCPKCGDTGNWERLLLQTLWSGWQCRKCHTRLRWSVWRKLMPMPVWVSLFAVYGYAMKLLLPEGRPLWVLAVVGAIVLIPS